MKEISNATREMISGSIFSSIGNMFIMAKIVRRLRVHGKYSKSELSRLYMNYPAVKTGIRQCYGDCLFLRMETTIISPVTLTGRHKGNKETDV